MAVVISLSLNCHKPFPAHAVAHSQYPNFKPFNSRFGFNHRKHKSTYFAPLKALGHRHPIVYKLNREDSNLENVQEADNEVNNLGVKAALSMLNFYKREISPVLPKSCRFVPTCSEYSMEAYKKYGVIKGTVLTTWRLCRCNPLGGSGFDPPRWFGETSTLPDE
uniref:Membrane protein insertion efficiency factor n=1 Tax=Fagus sylvatica TaxID=28930 RepID=A0A2N9GU34_FAGSY